MCKFFTTHELCGITALRMWYECGMTVLSWGILVVWLWYDRVAWLWHNCGMTVWYDRVARPCYYSKPLQDDCVVTAVRLRNSSRQAERCFICCVCYTCIKFTIYELKRHLTSWVSSALCNAFRNFLAWLSREMFSSDSAANWFFKSYKTKKHEWPELSISL